MRPLAFARVGMRGVRWVYGCGFEPWQRPRHDCGSRGIVSGIRNGRGVKDEVNALSIRELAVLVFGPLVGHLRGASGDLSRERCSLDCCPKGTPLAAWSPV